MGNTTPGARFSENQNSNKTLTVDVLLNENANNPVDVIVCFVDTKWSSDDQISQAISSLAGNIYTTEREALTLQHPRCTPGEIFKCSGGKLNCKTILFVVVPDGDLSQQFVDLCGIMKNVIWRASELHANSIAVPLGIGPPFQADAILPVFYMNYLQLDAISKSSSLTEFHILTLDPNIQSQILRTIEDIDEKLVENSRSSEDGESVESIENLESSPSNYNESCRPQPVVQGTDLEQEAIGSPSRLNDLQERETHENSLGRERSPLKPENDDKTNGTYFENSQSVPELVHATQEVSNTSVDVATGTEGESGMGVTTSTSLFSVAQILHKQVENVSEKEFLKSVNLRTVNGSNTRSVTFSEEVEEYVGPQRPPVVRSISSESDEGPSSLDFQNFSVKRPVTRRQGNRPIQRGEPVVVAQYDEEISVKKADPVFFCVICQSEQTVDREKKLDKCEHVFCEECIQDYFAQEKPVCPVCNTAYGYICGNMPPGLMSYFISKQHLPGHQDVGIIVIEYDIPDGVQTEEHPHPGKPFKGTSRMVFLPDSQQGQKCHRLLQKAFDQRLTFTVGRSRTTGREDCVTWNDIHHKTNVQGGPERFGYPDPSYLDRLEKELRDRGITED